MSFISNTLRLFIAGRGIEGYIDEHENTASIQAHMDYGFKALFRYA